MKLKTCTKCGDKHPATTGYFPSDRRHKDGLQSWCRKCHRTLSRILSKKYHQQHSERIKEYRKEYLQTLNGYLRGIFYHIKQRCNNPKCKDYKWYGKCGIKCLFTSDEFVDYVKDDLGITSINQIKGLDIDRIDNGGHYERGNIQFVTHSENLKNRRKWKK